MSYILYSRKTYKYYKKTAMTTMSDEFPMDNNGDSREICYELDQLKDRVDAQITLYEEEGRRWDI